MIEKQSLNLNIQFLEKNLNMLREKKEQYFASSFLEQLEDTAFELLEAINQKSNVVAEVPQLAPTKISGSFIDLCLDSITGQIKKLNLQSKQMEPHVKEELAVIAYDLFCLAVYIRFTLDPIGLSSLRNAFIASSDSEKNSAQEVFN